MIGDFERIDDLQCEGLRIIQDSRGFCFGMDAVLLAGFSRVARGGRCLDLCCGNGVVPILMSAKNPGASFAGIEIQPAAADLARRSVALNGLCGRIEIVCGDIRRAGEIFAPGSFDVVTANPPYLEADGLKNDSDAKAIARHEIACNVSDIAACAAQMLNEGGKFFLIHRPHRIVDIIFHLRKNRIEPKTIRYIQPLADRPPNMVLIAATKGGRPFCKTPSPLIIRGSDGEYTPEILEIYNGKD